MFLLLAFKELDFERYESHAYRTEQHWFNRDFSDQDFGERKQQNGIVFHSCAGRLRDPPSQWTGRR